MKNVTLLAISLFIFTGLNAQKKIPTLLQLSSTKNTTEEVFTLPGQKRLASPLRQTANKLATTWYPGHSALFMYDPEQAEWMPDIETDMTYDSKGNLLTENDGYGLYSYKYNANNMKTEYLEQELLEEGGVINIQKKVYQYDPIVTNLIVDQKFYDWNDQTKDWELAYHHKRNVIRNKEGNVTSCTTLLAGGDTFTKMDSICAIYDDRLIAVECASFSINENTWELDEYSRAKKIVWQNTDGQLVIPYDQMISGNNRIKSAELTAYDSKGKMKVNYIEDDPSKPDFSCVITFGDNSSIDTHILETIDANGSYKISGRFTTKAGEVETVEYDKYTIEKNDHFGYLIETATFDNLITPNTQKEGVKFDYTYLKDADKLGTPEEVVTSFFNEELAAYETSVKLVYSNFNQAGVGTQQNVLNKEIRLTILNDKLSFQSAAARYTIFNLAGQPLLQGVTSGENTTLSVNAIPSGVYILSLQTANELHRVKFVK